MENGELKINSLSPSGYSLYKQRESWYLFPKTKTIPASSVYRGGGSKADEGVLFKIIKSKIPWAGYLILS